mgnify:CR=1 FL=1
MKLINQKLLFFVLFVSLGLAALQVPLVHLAGSKAQFTLFDSFGPVAGAFLGSLPGAAAVLIMQITNFLMHGSQVLDAGSIIRFIPMMFATLYFAKQNKLNWIVPVFAILVFNLHPVGRSVWYYSMFWLIPVVCYFWQDKFILARSLGATFMAHAAGGAIWIWVFHLPESVWISLIPIVIVERLLFACGMAVCYLALKNILDNVWAGKELYEVHTDQD